MSWGTSFTPDLFIIRQTFRSKEELKGKIEDVRIDINFLREKILMYSSCTPINIMSEEGNLLDVIHYNINELLNEIKDSTILLFQLNLFLDYLEEKGGDILNIINNQNYEN